MTAPISRASTTRRHRRNRLCRRALAASPDCARRVVSRGCATATDASPPAAAPWTITGATSTQPVPPTAAPESTSTTTTSTTTTTSSTVVATASTTAAAAHAGRRRPAEPGVHRRCAVAQPVVAASRAQLRWLQRRRRGHGLHADARSPATGRRRRRRRRVPPRNTDRPDDKYTTSRCTGCPRRLSRRSPTPGSTAARRQATTAPTAAPPVSTAPSTSSKRTASVSRDGANTRRDRPAGVRRRRIPGRPPLVHVRLQRARPPSRRGVAIGVDRTGADHRRRDAGPSSVPRS